MKWDIGKKKEKAKLEIGQILLMRYKAHCEIGEKKEQIIHNIGY